MDMCALISSKKNNAIGLWCFFESARNMWLTFHRGYGVRVCRHSIGWDCITDTFCTYCNSHSEHTITLHPDMLGTFSLWHLCWVYHVSQEMFILTTSISLSDIVNVAEYVLVAAHRGIVILLFFILILCIYLNVFGLYSIFVHVNIY